MSEPGSGGSSGAAAAACTPPPPPPPPSTHLEFIADYVLDCRKAGSGGLGVVYPAVHQPTGQRVALKLGSAFAPHERHRCGRGGAAGAGGGSQAVVAGNAPRVQPLIAAIACNFTGCYFADPSLPYPPIFLQRLLLVNLPH
jgi:hypothetical protein